MMRRWRVTITMPDGSRGRHYGIYASGFDAVMIAMDYFPTARRISAWRLP
jgi:hypothetical protein